MKIKIDEKEVIEAAPFALLIFKKVIGGVPNSSEFFGCYISYLAGQRKDYMYSEKEALLFSKITDLHAFWSNYVKNI